MKLKGCKVVVIDDSKAIRSFLRAFLEDEGMEFYEAANAIEGFKICQNEKIDLAILDLGLPDFDGLEILPKIKQIENKFPIIVLTARRGKEVVESVYAKGADAYLSKPFALEELLEIIEKKLCLT